MLFLSQHDFLKTHVFYLFTFLEISIVSLSDRLKITSSIFWLVVNNIEENSRTGMNFPHITAANDERKREREGERKT